MAAPTKQKSFSAEAQLVKELTSIFDASELSELELETESVSVRLARGAAPALMAMPAASPVAAAAPATLPPTAATPAAAVATSAPDHENHPGALKSPMVGTVYLAPEPNAPAFANVGDKVKKGQTLFIVEAMKVMNPITAPNDGTITQILVDNAQPIEFDQPLAIIE